jgi:hypothetical protein
MVFSVLGLIANSICFLSLLLQIKYYSHLHGIALLKARSFLALCFLLMIIFYIHKIYSYCKQKQTSEADTKNEGN